MSKLQVWLFGNPDFNPDALPLKLLPELQQRLPSFDLIIKDPNEEWRLSKKLIIIDTVQGIKKITTFTSLDQFQNAPNITVHDFDLLTNLKWLSKLKKLPPFLIIGLPAGISKKEAFNKIIAILTPISFSGSGKRSSCTDHTP
ncbi:MAG: hypothetical protein ABIH36_03975 [bacterium]